MVEGIRAYRVYKFFPPRCPKCMHPFSSTDDFGLWGGSGSSYADALVHQLARFPELYTATPSKWASKSFSNRFEVDFIICKHCKNVSLRIHYAWRQVRILEEAERLVNAQGFTGWHEIQVYGNAPVVDEELGFLGRLDLEMLRSQVGTARRGARAIEDPMAQGDAFAAALDPALVEFVRKSRERRVFADAHERICSLFGMLWNGLNSDCLDFLVTADVLMDDLTSYSDTDPSIDFTPAVQMYSNALEAELLAKLFVPLKESPSTPSLPDPTGDKQINRSIEFLKAFIRGTRKLTLGDMAFCIRNVGCGLRGAENNSFATFLTKRLFNLDHLCDRYDFPGRLLRYVEEYRNRAAHVSRLTKQECVSARAYLLEEPIRLLLVLEEHFHR